jgi:hypothetical protein
VTGDARRASSSSASEVPLASDPDREIDILPFAYLAGIP